MTVSAGLIVEGSLDVFFAAEAQMHLHSPRHEPRGVVRKPSPYIDFSQISFVLSKDSALL